MEKMLYYVFMSQGLRKELDLVVDTALLEALSLEEDTALDSNDVLDEELGMQSIDALHLLFLMDKMVEGFTRKYALVACPPPKFNMVPILHDLLDGRMTPEQRTSLLQQGFPGILDESREKHQPEGLQKDSAERWGGTLPCTVGRLKEIAWKMIESDPCVVVKV